MVEVVHMLVAVGSFEGFVLLLGFFTHYFWWLQHSVFLESWVSGGKKEKIL